MYHPRPNQREYQRCNEPVQGRSRRGCSDPCGPAVFCLGVGKFFDGLSCHRLAKLKEIMKVARLAGSAG